MRAFAAVRKMLAAFADVDVEESQQLLAGRSWLDLGRALFAVQLALFCCLLVKAIFGFDLVRP